MRYHRKAPGVARGQREAEVGIMLCAERDSLQQVYRVAAQSFRESIHDLVVLVDHSGTDSEFNLAHLRIRAARGTCEVARAASEHHQADHGC